MNKQKKQVKWVVIIKTIALVLAAYVVLAGIFIYFFGSSNTLIRKTENIIPYPAASVGAKVITMGKLEDRLNSVRMFYENQDFSDLGMRVDFSTADGKKRLMIKKKNALDKLIENTFIQSLANKRSITVTSDIVDQEVNKKLEQYGNADDTAKNIQKLYGWTVADFKNNIVMPDLYQEKLFADVITNEKDFVDAKNKIDAAQKELQGGKEFESVVAQYSEGDSAKNRGDLGWLSAQEMLPEIAPAVFSLEKGKTSDIINSSLGYHIIRVDDKKTEDGVDKVRLKQIFVRSKNFSDWLCEQEKNYKIYIFSKDYSWNKDKCSVEFRNNDMKKFEENVVNSSPNDPSVMF